jgi:DNA-binding transcriptional LysR family regulator
MLLEKGAKAEISEIFERAGLTPRVRFTTWDDYAVMSMVESGLGVSILPQLILKAHPVSHRRKRTGRARLPQHRPGPAGSKNGVHCRKALYGIPAVPLSRKVAKCPARAIMTGWEMIVWQ